MMEKNKQTQSAGDNSQQIQAGTVNVYNGITEQRAREICKEEFENFGAVQTQEAFVVAQQRVQKLEDVVIPKMAQMDKALDAFADPAFQFVLRDAQRTAAATERESDYELLSELLVERVNHGNDRKRSLSVSEAIKIVDKIDDDALCALTVLFSVKSLVPLTGNISEGINLISNVFDSLLTTKLPTGEEWIYHLELLKAIRINSLGSLKRFSDYYYETLSGYTCIGIVKNSDSYNQALKILSEAGLDYQVFLCEHELNPNYIRINVESKKEIRNIKLNVLINGTSNIIDLSESQYTALEKVYDLYNNDNDLKIEVKSRFVEKLMSHESIKIVANWWDSISLCTVLTEIGNVLANANAQKLNPIIPNGFNL